MNEQTCRYAKRVYQKPIKCMRLNSVCKFQQYCHLDNMWKHSERFGNCPNLSETIKQQEEK